MSGARRPRNSCPRCGEALLRVRRRPEDHQLQLSVPARRYSCTSGECSWQGMVPISLDLYGRRQRRSMARWRLQPWMLGALVFVVAAASAAYGLHRLQRAVRLTPGLAAGESHDGVPLPGSHPLRRQLAAAAAASASEASVDLGAAPGAASTVIAQPVAAAGTPSRSTGTSLDLRQGCAWGQPGRSPYRGTVEEALQAARVPADVVRQIVQKVKAREVIDRVRISTGSIRGVAGGREFEPRSIAMSFGRTLCLQTRVNFVAGHVEEADLYEASDASGRRYSVMVPDVCGNVSVLGVRGEREDPLLMGADVQGGAGQASGDPSDPGAVHPVPEPGSLASVLAGLLGLWAVWRCREHRRTAKAPPKPDDGSV